MLHCFTSYLMLECYPENPTAHFCCLLFTVYVGIYYKNQQIITKIKKSNVDKDSIRKVLM